MENTENNKEEYKEKESSIDNANNNENNLENNKPVQKVEENNNIKKHKEEQKEVKKEIKKPEKPKEPFNFSKSYDKYYKVFIFLPVIVLLFGLIYLGSFEAQHGDIIRKDITLSGGTSVQINSNIDIVELRSVLEKNFEEVTVRKISDSLTGEQLSIIVETTASVDKIQPFLEDYLGYELTSENSSIEFTGSSLSGSFYNQLRFAIILSFILMAITVFVIFRSFVPSLAVVFAAFTDIVMTIVIVNLLGMKVSTAGIVAFLMLIGYSVDTDILLTTRVLKRRDESVNSRIYGAFKTGMTMTLTSLIVVIIGYFLTAGFSKVFSQIFTIVIIGLVFDMINTWLFNASLIKWYMEKKK